MTTNPTEMFNMFANTLNQQAQAIQQQTQALQMAYQQALQSMQQQAQAPQQVAQPVNQDAVVQQMVQQQVSAMMPELMKQAAAAATQVNQVPTPVAPVQPVVEDQVKHAEFIPGNKLEHLAIAIQKPCATCPFKDSCTLKGSQISTQCGVDHMKQAAMNGGEIHIKVSVDDDYKFQFKAYKDGMYIGNVATNTVQSKPLVAELEKHINRTVVVLAHPKNLNSTAHSTFTNFDVEILNVIDDVPTPEPVVVPEVTQPMVHEPVFAPEPVQETTQQESSSLLGDMVLPFQF